MKHEHMIAFRCAQLWAMCKLAVAYIIALFYKRKNIWVIAERGVDARDNGYWLFKYMCQVHPEIEAYYVISSDSPDRKRLIECESRLLPYRSLAHYILLWRAAVLISTHVQGYFPFSGLGLWFRKICPFYNSKLHVNIKHGITKDHMSFLDYSNTQLDMIVAGVNQEYSYFISQYKYPKEVVQLTGFCRFDGLYNKQSKQQILLMPTWREWLYKTDDFMQSEYVKKYISLLNNTDLLKLLERKSIDLVFYPHHEVQKHISIFKQKCQGAHIIIADKEAYDVQQLLVDSSLLVTDYSSVYFDFAYMNKPVLFYQFDIEQFRREHYAEGWYDYNNGLGPVVIKESECVSFIENACDSGFSMPENYRIYANRMFPYRDNHNCERVFNAICIKQREKK